MEIIAHTMEYTGPVLAMPPLCLRHYADADEPAYRAAYNHAFAPMRRALGLQPVYCCAERAELLEKAGSIFILEADGALAGSVALYGNEIDDLFVAEDFLRKGYGQGLLRFAVARMQRAGVRPIILHVADWNQKAIKLYERNGFRVTATQAVH